MPMKREREKQKFPVSLRISVVRTTAIFRSLPDCWFWIASKHTRRLSTGSLPARLPQWHNQTGKEETKLQTSPFPSTDFFWVLRTSPSSELRQSKPAMPSSSQMLWEPEEGHLVCSENQGRLPKGNFLSWDPRMKRRASGGRWARAFQAQGTARAKALG